MVLNPSKDVPAQDNSFHKEISPNIQPTSPQQLFPFTLRSLLWDLIHSWMKSWGLLLKLSIKSLCVFSWLMDSMVSWIWGGDRGQRSCVPPQDTDAPACRAVPLAVSPPTLASREAISCWLVVEARKLLIWALRGSSTSTSMS